MKMPKTNCLLVSSIYKKRLCFLLVIFGREIIVRVGGGGGGGVGRLTIREGSVRMEYFLQASGAWKGGDLTS